MAVHLNSSMSWVSEAIVYGIVYCAVDARQPSGPKLYAVKCLVSSGRQTPR